MTGLHLPQFPVITRWGTWIRCYKYLPDVIHILEEGMEEEEEHWKKLISVGDSLDEFAKYKFEEQSRCEILCNFD